MQISAKRTSSGPSAESCKRSKKATGSGSLTIRSGSSERIASRGLRRDRGLQMPARAMAKRRPPDPPCVGRTSFVLECRPPRTTVITAFYQRAGQDRTRSGRTKTAMKLMGGRGGQGRTTSERPSATLNRTPGHNPIGVSGCPWLADVAPHGAPFGWLRGEVSACRAVRCVRCAAGLARISTNRNSANNRPSNPLLLDEAQGQAVPPGDGRGFFEEIRVQDNG
jgi:hypothetical protein